MTKDRLQLSTSMKRSVYLFVFLLTFSFTASLHAQQANNWYFGGTTCFGGGVRLDFTSGTATLSPVNYPLKTLEGSSAISDDSGNPLFYTDGITIWDASTNASFGTSLGGDPSTTQSAIIVEKPGSSPQQWLVFTKGVETGSLQYYTVSGTLGSFTISSATTLVAAGIIGEGLTIVGSTNAADSYWVVTRDVGDNNIRSFAISTAGAVSGTAVLSGITYSDGTGSTTLKNQLTIKSNTCQNQLAFTYLNGIADIVNFDASTGTVVDKTAVKIGVGSTGGNNGSYGLEFSPDDKFLYITNLSGQTLYQYSIATNAIRTVVTLSGSRDAGQLALGPDKKIYMAIAGTGGAALSPSYLGVIDDPNNAASTLNQTEITISSVVDNLSRPACLGWGLPTFPKSLVASSLLLNPGNGNYCINDVISLSYIFGGTVKAGTLTWTATGSGQTFTTGGLSSTDDAPTVKFSTAGTKLVILDFKDQCDRDVKDTLTFIISLPKTPAGTVTCSSPNLILDNPATDPDEPKYVWYKNSVDPNNVMGVGTPVTYPVGIEGVLPTQVCIAVASSIPTTTTATNHVVGSGIGQSQAGPNTPYTSPAIDVLASNIYLKSFGMVFWFSATLTNLTVTIKQGATTVYTKSMNSVSVTGSAEYIFNVNTTLQKGTGYTITIATTPSVEFLSDAWAGTTINNEITYHAASAYTGVIRDIKYDYHNYSFTPVCTTPTCVPVSCTLPVEWVSVDAARTDADVLVNWGIAMELNNSHFDIQRSLDGQTFSTIGTVEGRGNSSTFKEYNYIDRNAPLTKVYYRIVQYDYDGHSSYSKIVVVNSTNAVDLVKVYPNPSAHGFNIEWLAEKAASYQVYDVRGTLIATGILDAANGIETIGETFATGVYIVKVSSADQAINLKLIKQ